MQLKDYFNVLAPDDIRLKGTRIRIESILYEYIYRCKTREEIAEQFHTVTLEQAQKAQMGSLRGCTAQTSVPSARFCSKLAFEPAADVQQVLQSLPSLTSKRYK